MFSVSTQLHLPKELFKVYNEYSRLYEEKIMIPKTHIIFVNYVYSISVLKCNSFNEDSQNARDYIKKDLF